MMTKAKYELILGDVANLSPDTVRKLKSTLLVDLNYSVEEIKEIMTTLPRSLKSAEEECELQPLLDTIRNSGAFAYIDEYELNNFDSSYEEYTAKDARNLNPIGIGIKSWSSPVVAARPATLDELQRQLGEPSEDEAQEISQESTSHDDEDGTLEFEIDLDEIQKAKRKKRRVYQLEVDGLDHQSVEMPDDSDSLNSLSLEQSVDTLIDAIPSQPAKEVDDLALEESSLELRLEEPEERALQERGSQPQIERDQSTQELQSTGSLNLELEERGGREGGEQENSSQEQALITLEDEVSEQVFVEQGEEFLAEEPALLISAAYEMPRKSVLPKRSMSEVCEQVASNQMSYVLLVVLFLTGNFIYFSPLQSQKGGESVEHQIAKMLSAIEARQLSSSTNGYSDTESLLIPTRLEGVEKQPDFTTTTRALIQGDKLRAIHVVVTTPAPPPLTWEEIADEEVLPPWAHTIKIEGLPITNLEDGNFVARGNAKTYIEYRGRRSRYIVPVMITGKVSVETAGITGIVEFGEATESVKIREEGNTFHIDGRFGLSAGELVQ